MPALPFIPPLLGWKAKKPNIADSSSETSCTIAEGLLKSLGVTQRVTHSPQTAGKMLEEAVCDHLAASLSGTLYGQRVVTSHKKVISDFAQYTHLATLQTLIEADPTGTLPTAIGTDYLIRPDVTVGLDSGCGPQFLHAAVSCKWTLRSDRAQNVRHEAVILIRHRRGRLPHVAFVTAEPLPTRLASLARGTGELDAVYHVALDELTTAVQTSALSARARKTQISVLEELKGNDRLRDLAELAGVLQRS